MRPSRSRDQPWRAKRPDATTPTVDESPPLGALTGDAADNMLISFLNAQRTRALAIVAGLNSDQLGTPLLPSGWTPLGMIEHLGHAERHWFQQVAGGSAVALPWPDDPAEDDNAAFTTTRQADVVFAFYRDQIERANAALTSTPLSAPPVGRHNHGNADQVTDLRFIVLHMIEETARHLGHLDAARELLDGRTGLGQDDL
jgi:uncharacterized damage-inducible protein DinB